MADRKVIDLSVADSTDIQSSNAVLYLVNPDRVLDADKDRKLPLRSRVVLTSETQSVAGDKTFTGDNTFTGTLVFSGNATFNNTITGDISGNAGTVTNGVYTSRQINTGTGLSGGGDLSADRTIGIASGFGLIPSGGIIMWSGSVASIPSGWYLCDGNNGTPNLQDRFIVGAGSSYAVDATGGASSVTLTTSQMPSHTHSDGTLSAALAGSHYHTGTTEFGGGHSHTGTTNTAGTHDHSGANGILSGIDSARSGSRTFTSGSFAEEQLADDGSHSHTLTTDYVASHTHTFNTSNQPGHTHDVTGNTGSAGSGSAHENRPPYYALAFIMKA